MPKRKEIEWSLVENSTTKYPEGMTVRANIELTFTRRGVLVSGFYDSMVGIGDQGFISWDELFEFKAQLDEVQPTGIVE